MFDNFFAPSLSFHPILPPPLPILDARPPSYIYNTNDEPVTVPQISNKNVVLQPLLDEPVNYNAIKKSNADHSAYKTNPLFPPAASYDIALPAFQFPPPPPPALISVNFIFKNKLNKFTKKM